MWMFLSLLPFLLLVTNIDGRHEMYEGHQVYLIEGTANEIFSIEVKLDFLETKQTGSDSFEATVRLGPEEQEQWVKYFENHNLKYTKTVENLAEVFRSEDVELENARNRSRQSGESMTWDSFYHHHEINNYVDQIGLIHSNHVRVFDAGFSTEGRQIKYLRISTTNFEDLRKPVIILDAAVHAREWISPPVALYTLHQLVVEQADRRLLEEIDWVIIPIVNPDGYEYAMDVDRLWRKTRSKLSSETCPGVDGNRNYNHQWGTFPDYENPCSVYFQGHIPFSEPETRIVREVILSQSDRAKLYISLHSPGPLLLYPWGNASLPDNVADLQRVGDIISQKISDKALRGADKYIVGNTATTLRPNSGTSRDWALANGIPLTYTMELTGYGSKFLVPTDLIRQIVSETWDGIAAASHYILDNLDSL